jgi:hypothetical protein
VHHPAVATATPGSPGGFRRGGKWIATPAYAATTYRQTRKNRDLEALAERIEELGPAPREDGAGVTPAVRSGP